MKRLSLKVALSEPKYKCAWCGRLLIDKVAHRCNTGFRKRNNKWIEL